MAIRKPVEAAEKSAAMAELLAGAGKGVTFKTGSIVEGTVSAVKGDSVYTDIGYKSEGVVRLDEFLDPAEAVPGHKFNVMIVALSLLFNTLLQCMGLVVLQRVASSQSRD